MKVLFLILLVSLVSSCASKSVRVQDVSDLRIKSGIDDKKRAFRFERSANRVLGRIDAGGKTLVSNPDVSESDFRQLLVDILSLPGNSDAKANEPCRHPYEIEIIENSAETIVSGCRDSNSTKLSQLLKQAEVMILR